ncbi:Oxidoreductase [Rhodococcus sp. RD6.2]|jgi:aryl-alcohol dehydrogenase-like predicted oxidoreductase|uniref:aldo/keto reductase n=1 Tax=Rhodococcus sp. RD6.2 TaxID=260936 RepID=UPI00063B4D33|nr:aldo/keto reductase [Rhodococcus sp. RD6.2]CRK51028.1 Oxidoreductase [Rhodococcus sp. RD6.2]
MKQRTVGRSGLRVSRLGLGTLSWGRDTDGDEAAAQLLGFVEAGGTLVDSSPFYGGGTAQRILAELLDDVVPRADLVISSSGGVHPGGVDCSRRALLAQLDDTLRELGTDHLDLWQVATWDPQTPVDEIAATLAYAVESGRVRYVGARGHLGWQLATAATSRALGSAPLTATQAEYSLLARGVEEELIPAAQHHAIGMFAAVPLAGGVLTGKYRGGVPADSRGAADATAESVSQYLTADAGLVVDAVITAADGLGASPLAVALAWVRDQPGVASAIVGARDYAQVTGVLAAEELELPAAIAAALDDVSA